MRRLLSLTLAGIGLFAPAVLCATARSGLNAHCRWRSERFGLAGKTAGTRGLKVSASTTLGPRERVVIVEVDDARLVLGVTASNINVLHKLPPAPVTVEERAQAPADFQSVMKSLLKRSGRS